MLKVLVVAMVAALVLVHGSDGTRLTAEEKIKKQTEKIKKQTENIKTQTKKLIERLEKYPVPPSDVYLRELIMSEFERIYESLSDKSRIKFKLETSRIINDSLSNLLTGTSDVDKLKEHESLVNKLKQLMGRKLVLKEQEAAKKEALRLIKVSEENKTRP